MTQTKKDSLAVLSVLSLGIIALLPDFILLTLALSANKCRPKKGPTSTVSLGVRHSSSQVIFNGKAKLRSES